MTTVGYGDIAPKNSVEVVCCIFIMLIACCVFAHSLNQFGAIFEEIYR